MAEPQEEQIPPTPEKEDVKASPPPPPPQVENPYASFSIWPPSQRTREAVVRRLVETLSSPSVLSKRYGVLPLDEATDAARLIEEAAFSAAAGEGGAAADSVDGGIEILQAYSREISQRMLQSAKAKANSAPAPSPSPVEGGVTAETGPPSAAATPEEVSSVESEAS